MATPRTIREDAPVLDGHASPQPRQDPNSTQPYALSVIWTVRPDDTRNPDYLTTTPVAGESDPAVRSGFASDVSRRSGHEPRLLKRHDLCVHGLASPIQRGHLALLGIVRGRMLPTSPSCGGALQDRRNQRIISYSLT